MPHWHPLGGPVVPGAGLGVSIGVPPVVIGTGVSPVTDVVLVTGVSPVTAVVPVAPGSLHVDPCILLFMNAMFSVTLE